MGASPLSVETVDRLEPLIDEWNDLADRTHACPFMRPGWIASWLRAFGRGRLVIFAARRRGRLDGLLPLERRAGVLRSPTNAHTPEFGMLAEEDAARGLASAVFAHAGRAVVLEYLDTEAAGFEVLLEAARAAGYRQLVRPVARSPYLRASPSLAEHERSLSTNLRHDVERRLRRLGEVGAVSVQICDGRERLDQLLEDGFRVEQLSWKGGRGTAVASQSQTRSFYADVARWAASAGWLTLAFLRLDDQPIAFQFDLETPGTYYSLKIGYDPAYERFSPGKVLTYAMVSRAVSRGMSTYELLGRDEPWKQSWTDTSREHASLQAFASSAAGYLTWSAFVHGRSLARRIPFASRAAASLRR